MNRMVGFPAVLLGLIASVGLTGCATTGTGQVNRASQGAVIGSLLGAGLGAVVGHQSRETGEGATIGAAAGALGGYVLGNEQDKVEMQTQTTQAVQAANAAAAMSNTVVINVNNSNGSVTPITLHRQGNLYVGPRGEYYTQLPSEDQLRPVYGF